MPESVHKKLERVRAPRVHIGYDVEIGDAIELMELPFVMGVLADLSGQPAEPPPSLADRKFVEITPDNFDDVLKEMKPRVAFRVDDKLSEDPEGKIGVELSFESMEDFSPDRVARRVEPLSKLLELRQKLADLRGSLQGNDKLEQILQETIQDVERMRRIQTEHEGEEGSDGQA